MKISLTQRAIGLLNSIIREPVRLPLQYLELKQYSTPPNDETAKKQMIRLQEWLEKIVCIKGRKDADGNDTIEFPKDGWTGGIKQTYLDRLKEVVKHYDKVGGLVNFARQYVELTSGLDGKELEGEGLEDDVSEDSSEKIVQMSDEKAKVKEA